MGRLPFGLPRTLHRPLTQRLFRLGARLRHTVRIRFSGSAAGVLPMVSLSYLSPVLTMQTTRTAAVPALSPGNAVHITVTVRATVTLRHTFRTWTRGLPATSNLGLTLKISVSGTFLTLGHWRLLSRSSGVHNAFSGNHEPGHGRNSVVLSITPSPGAE